MPAFQNNILEKIEDGLIPYLSSIAFCLEDSIQDSAVEQAEDALRNTFHKLAERNILKNRIPFIFVRVRSPEQMLKLHREFGDTRERLTGYILPKFDLNNAEAYLDILHRVNRESDRIIYIMPILESKMVADRSSRLPALIKLRQMLETVRPYVLNIRVGANDFCNLYGLRRSVHQTIYDIGVVRDILMDILNLFAQDYVVSGPVWNYFGKGGESWADGLRRELEFDRQNGFIGKTAIHPSQLPLIARSLSVKREDYEDACALLEWGNDPFGVKKSVNGERMNEVKCHKRWAERTKLLGEIYGIQNT